MPGITDAFALQIGQHALPAGQKLVIKAKIPPAPHDQRRMVAELPQLLLDAHQRVPARVGRILRDVAHEGADRHAMGPGIVGKQVSAFLVLGELPPVHGHARRRSGEAVQAAHQQRTDQRPAAERDAQRDVVRRKRGGVEDDQAPDHLGMTPGEAKADRPAPVVDDQVHALEAQ